MTEVAAHFAFNNIQMRNRTVPFLSTSDVYTLIIGNHAA
jgi:hypothetical protein